MRSWRKRCRAGWLGVALLAGLLAGPPGASAAPVIDLPQYPEIDRAALERYAARTLAQRESRARAAGELGCVRYCAMLQHAFMRITGAAREQGEPAGGAVQWQLVATTTRGEAAFSLPGGHVLVSEDMIAELDLTEAELAFILAHETAHVLLQHEAEVLGYLQATLTPRGLRRSVWDLYAELDYNAAALLRLESLMQQGELEADYAGLLIGAQAGYPPEAMLSALQKLAGGGPVRAAIVTTHPAMAQRIERVRAAMPAAQRLFEVTAVQR